MMHKLFTKIMGIFGYKLIDKEIFKNSRLISNISYLKIDRLLKNLFEKKKNISLIQIGANDGKRFDILNYYIKKYQTKSLLVEPIKKNFLELVENYKDCKFVSIDNSAISVDNEISYLYKVDEKFIDNYSDHIPGITSFDKKHLIKHGVKNRHIITENVNSLSIVNLISKYHLADFDLLYIDAEGYDGKIAIDLLKSTSLRPITILEFIHVKNNTFRDLITNLKKNEYIIFSIDENLCCYPRNKREYIEFS